MKKSNKFLRLVAVILTAVMVMCTFSGCLLDEPLDGDFNPDDYYDSSSSQSSDDSGKGLLDDLLDILGDDSDSSGSYYSTDDDDSYGGGYSQGSDDSDDFMSMLFDSFFGGDSSDYGWGESSYSGGSLSSDFDYADISDVASGTGKATVMVYMIGSNLESDSGCGTMDIQEMVGAKVGSNVNIIVEAGGAKKWQNSVMSNGKTGRYKVVADGIQVLETASKKSMVENSELLDFVKYCKNNFPADRYAIIFWDHGGGTLAGFGMDDLYDGDLSLDEISSVLNNSGVHFDFVGFDACLMGTIETAYALKDCADYLIAAEEEEPGYGWYYTSWLKALDKNPSLDMAKLGSIIVDDFVAANGSDDVTLSVVDLSQIENVYLKMAALFANGSKEIYAGKSREISKARKNSKAYGGSDFDQIDIIDFCNKCGLDGADEVVTAINSAVIYHKTNIDRTNGLAMYFPYDYPSYYNSILKMVKSFGMNNKSYYGFFDNLLSSRSGGTGARSKKPIEIKTGYEEEDTQVDLATQDWYVAEVAQAEEPVKFDVDEDGFLIPSDNYDGLVIELTEDQFDIIAFADTGVYYDDGEGYIDFGNDSFYNYDDNGNLVFDYNFQWVAINGQFIPFYLKDEGVDAFGRWYSYGISYALFTSARTGEERAIEILIHWDEEHPDGYVKGYRPFVDDEDGPVMSERNVTNFVKGDKIDFVCGYYTYDGEFDDAYLLGDQIVVDSPLVVSYEEMEDAEILFYGHIRDLYGNDYYTDFCYFE